MRIPGNPVEREGFYWDVVQRCLVSRSDRRAQNDTLRHYMLFGSAPDGNPALFNKIDAQIDQLNAYLFAADTTRFSIVLGAEVNVKDHLPRVKPLIKRLNDKWQDSNADTVFGSAVTWALTYNTTLIKLIQRGAETMPFMVDPSNFGVLREDVPFLDRQEAFVQTFLTTKDQMRRDLMDHPQRDLILARLSASQRVAEELPAGVQRIIVAATYPLASGSTLTGNAVPPLSGIDMYRPRTSEELVEMYELWLWDDGVPLTNKRTGRVGGWRVVTLSDPSICVYDRLAYNPDTKDGTQMFLEGDHPFTHVCPNPLPDYFWGQSEVGKLIYLQESREKHISQANEIVDRNVTSPKAVKGMWGAVDEKTLALQKLGAILSSTADPTAEVKEFKPTVPSDLWQLVSKDDEMFDEASALTNISKGRGEAGVRSKGQTDALLRAGSARPKKRALIIEDSLERIATQYLKLDQMHNKRELHEEKDGEPGAKFLSAQFTDNYMVKVDGHSSSPVFMDEQKNLGFELFDREVIDGDALLDMAQPQNVQALKVRYRDMTKAKQEQAAREEQLRQAEVDGKVSKIR